jgi:hypothetical protein
VPRDVRIILSACERTVDGGTAMTTWLYYDGERWQSIKDHPHATFTRLDCGPGVLWETVAEVLLPVGTWLTRIDRIPDHTLEPEDPLVYLQRQVRTRRYRSRRTTFRANTGGKLVRVSRKNAPV